MKIAIVGTGSRHKMFRDAIVADYAGEHELVALCDTNSHRLNLAAEAVRDEATNGVATYLAEDFLCLLEEHKPDTIVITTPDFLHHKYIAAAFEAGCDVICEKPMTIDLEKLKTIIDAQNASSKSATITFNYRYSPPRTQVKDLLQKGIIGKVTAVDFRWHLDRVHGADYFRRWHRQKEFSGGLLVHKATHHFDLLNWWLDSTPTQVLATGSRAFYRPETAHELGLAGHGLRCSACNVANKCDLELNLGDHPDLQNLYQDAEHLDGYLRDQCVFDANIDIEDTVQAHIRYANGASANYSLVAYSPWEGFEVRFQGTRGELIHSNIEVHGVFGGKRKTPDKEEVSTVIHLAGELPEDQEIWHGEGTHGGADPLMLGDIFGTRPAQDDAYNRASDHIMGGWSILTGIAANKSIETGSLVNIDTMLRSHGINLPRPN